MFNILWRQSFKFLNRNPYETIVYKLSYKMWLLLPACLKNRKESVRQGPRLISSGSGNQTRKMYICQKLKDFIKRTAQAVRSRDAKRKRYCCVLIVNNQLALLIALADYAISDKLAVRGGIGGTLCAESFQNDRHSEMLCLEACNNDRWVSESLIPF